MEKRRVVIAGAGFAGLNAAKILGRSKAVDVTVIDQRNYHLFQPLLYQVAMAALSPADIAAPIRSILPNSVEVLKGRVDRVDVERGKVVTDFADLPYDYLILACGAQHAYFGNESWEPFAPGLKTLTQATEMRRRVLNAFELAERTVDPAQQRRLMTFVIVGGGPTGVELAGAIGEMSRYTLARDFRHIDPKSSRVILVEAGPRVLAGFAETHSSRATRALESLGVQVWPGSRVTNIDERGVRIGEEFVETATVLWAAGVQASSVGATLDAKLDPAGRVFVEPDLSLPNHGNVFVTGDLAHFEHQTGSPLPGVAAVAVQQGQFAARTVLDDMSGKPRRTFVYKDKGQMATIGRSRAVARIGKFKLSGHFAWVLWLLAHVYYLTGFKNRLSVTLQWAWSYFTFGRGARLIVDKGWRSYGDGDE